MQLTKGRQARARQGFAAAALLSGILLSGCATHQGAAPPRIAGPDARPGNAAQPRLPNPMTERMGLNHSVYEIPSAGGCPRDMARAGAACVDRYEASLVLPDGRTPYPFNRPVHEGSVSARNAPGVFPQGHINQIQAERACRNAGKRLCTKEEWQAACRGPGNAVFPYGDEYRPGYCNTRAVHPPGALFGLDYRNRLNDPRLNLFPGGLARTGSHRRCSSEYGVFDMVGNLHEWVSDRIALGGRLRGIFMGGFYSNDHENGRGCDYTTVAHEPEHYDYSTGFRCCRDAQ